MSKLLHILAAVLVLISLTSNTFADAQTIGNTQSSTSTTSPLKSSNINLPTTGNGTLSSIQNTLAQKLPNGKKQLKKQLALDYTNPKFETELTGQQKSAILTSLKKWKLDLPINNTFTVTSIADLKKNQKVVYMW